jgi:phage terminase large subunit-like protein
VSPRRVVQPTRDELFGLAVTELETSVRHPNILAYGQKSYPEQERFHHCSKPGRYVAGSNRGGKTDAAVVEAGWLAMDMHPWIDRPENWGHGAIQIRFVTVDIAKGVEQILIPKFKRWFPNSWLKGGDWSSAWDNNALVLTFSNGSTIDIVTWGMDMKKLGGVPRHVIFFDEEPPQNIFNESMMRLVDFVGWWIIAATPTEGMGWTYDLLWEPAVNQKKMGNLDWPVECFTLRMEDNPYLESTKEDRDFYMMGMSKEERSIREEGAFVARSGLVFPSVSQHPEKFILPADQIDMEVLKTWRWYWSVDHGWNNPTAIYWHAVSRHGNIITFAEQYAGQMTVSEHAKLVHEREKAWGKTPMLRVGDPAMKQTSGITGTSVLQAYAEAGININVETIPRSVAIGVEKMQQYFRLEDDTPMWHISSNCPNLIRELKRLRWATYSSDKTAYDLNKQEEIHKKDDHGFDSIRYFATVMPDLRPGPREHAPWGSNSTTIRFDEMMAMMRDDPTIQFVNDSIARPQTEWATASESYGDGDDYYGGSDEW